MKASGVQGGGGAKAFASRLVPRGYARFTVFSSIPGPLVAEHV